MCLFLINLLHNDCFDSLNLVAKVLSCLFVFYWSQFLVRIYNLIVVMFRLLQKRIVFFVFRLSTSAGVFQLCVSGKARFLPAVQTICRFGNFVKTSRNLYSLWFGLGFCLK